MIYPAIEGLIKSRSLRAILESKELAQLGDFLVNFIYSTVKIGIYDESGSVHVWDNSLRDAMEQAGLRSELGKSTKPDRVADAAEAFIAYCYFTEVMTLDEMIEYLRRRLIKDDFKNPTFEKSASAVSFGELLQRLAYLTQKNDRFD